MSKRMSRNRRRDTEPERAVRSALHASGLRFRVDYPLRLAELTVRPDVVFSRWHVAVFVDGCFWHGCPEHGNLPRRNRSYWGPKLQRNLDRDRRTAIALEQAGWQIIRAWEHESAQLVAHRVISVIDALRTGCGKLPAESRHLQLGLPNAPAG